MAAKRGYIRVSFSAIEPKRLLEILEMIEKMIATDPGASAELNIMPDIQSLPAPQSLLPRG
jgi:hypothetical protein